MFGAFLNFIVAIGGLGYAEPSDVLSLQTAISKARLVSPDLKALRAQYDSAKAKAGLALGPTEPTLTVNYNDMVRSFDTSNPSSTVYQITQPLGFPGKAWVNRAALVDAAHAVKHQVRAMELQVSTNVKAAYFALAQARENLSINEEQRRNYERIIEITKRRYATGAIPQVDLLNAEISFYSNANDLNDLRASERLALTQLNILMGVDTEKVWKLEELKALRYTLPSIEVAAQKMMENRSELNAAKSQLSSTENAYTLAKMSALPDFQLIAGMTHYNVPQASPLSSVDASIVNTYMFGVQMTVPLWFFFNERQVINGAHSDRAAAQSNLEILTNQSKAQLRGTIDTLHSLEFRLKNFEDHLLPLSEQALNLALINYSAGKIDFQTLAEAAASRRNNRRDYLAAIVNYVTSYSTLGQLTGEEL